MWTRSSEGRGTRALGWDMTSDVRDRVGAVLSGGLRRPHGLHRHVAVDRSVEPHVPDPPHEPRASERRQQRGHPRPSCPRDGRASALLFRRCFRLPAAISAPVPSPRRSGPSAGSGRRARSGCGTASGDRADAAQRRRPNALRRLTRHASRGSAPHRADRRRNDPASPSRAIVPGQPSLPSAEELGGSAAPATAETPPAVATTPPAVETPSSTTDTTPPTARRLRRADRRLPQRPRRLHRRPQLRHRPPTATPAPAEPVSPPVANTPAPAVAARPRRHGPRALRARRARRPGLRDPARPHGRADHQSDRHRRAGPARDRPASRPRRM